MIGGFWLNSLGLGWQLILSLRQLPVFVLRQMLAGFGLVIAGDKVNSLDMLHVDVINVLYGGVYLGYLLIYGGINFAISSNAN